MSSHARVDVVSHVPEVVRRLTTRMRVGMEVAGAFIEGEIKRSLSTPGPTKTSPDNPASKPGKPPHARTGNLRAQQSYQVEEESGKLILMVGAKAGPAEPYAARLEYGDEQSGKGSIAARPYARPAIFKNRKRIMKLIIGKGV